MDEQKFRQLVTQALDQLPKEFSEKLENVSVVVEEQPTIYQMQKAKIPAYSLLFGLYEGIPKTKRGIYYNNVPDKITIFKNAIEAVSQTEDDIRENVKRTVVHEIGHHFGLSDAELAS